MNSSNKLPPLTGDIYKRLDPLQGSHSGKLEIPLAGYTEHCPPVIPGKRMAAWFRVQVSGKNRNANLSR